MTENVTNPPEWVRTERHRRRELWVQFLQAGGPFRVSPDVLRDLRIYRGQAGIWADKDRTGDYLDDGRLTVSVLLVGGHYEDDIAEGELIYKYPRTNRPGTTDAAEIQATKNAGRYGVPIFVVRENEEDPSLRDVYWGYVSDWNAEAEEFFIRFAPDLDHLVRAVEAVDQDREDPFELTAERSSKTQERLSRPGQNRFRFDVKKRYGLQCAVCDMSVEALLEAVHIRDRSENGSNDARNGLLLCRNHHKAFDEGLFAIEPETLRLETSEEGPALEAMEITCRELEPLHSEPREEALRWAWTRWQEERE